MLLPLWLNSHMAWICLEVGTPNLGFKSLSTGKQPHVIERFSIQAELYKSLQTKVSLFHKSRFVKRRKIHQTSFPFRSRVPSSTTLKCWEWTFSLVIWGEGDHLEVLSHSSAAAAHFAPEAACVILEWSRAAQPGRISSHRRKIISTVLRRVP